MMRPARTHTRGARTPTSRPERNTGNPFPPKLAVASRRGDYKAPRFLPASPSPPSPLTGARSDATHDTCMPYLFRTLSTARSTGARFAVYTGRADN